MSNIHAGLGILGGLAALGMIGVTTQARAKSSPLAADLERVSRHTIYFGHQSVGRNVIDGLRELAASEGVPLRIVETADLGSVAPGTFAHGAVPDNGNPVLKLRSFERVLGTGAVDVALVKFCYVDIDASTDVRALFSEYEATFAALEKKYPRTTFVHVTLPLTTVQGGWKGAAKTLLGRTLNGAAENARRDEFNSLLRTAVAGRPLFDLARAESTRPDGSAETFDWKGRRVPALVTAYSSDGGHLNGEGAARAAHQLLAVLASLPVKPTAAR
jgi:hypothetical protein